MQLPMLLDEPYFLPWNPLVWVSGSKLLTIMPAQPTTQGTIGGTFAKASGAGLVLTHTHKHKSWARKQASRRCRDLALIHAQPALPLTPPAGTHTRARRSQMSYPPNPIELHAKEGGMNLHTSPAGMNVRAHACGGALVARAGMDWRGS